MRDNFRSLVWGHMSFARNKIGTVWWAALCWWEAWVPGPMNPLKSNTVRYSHINDLYGYASVDYAHPQFQCRITCEY